MRQLHKRAQAAALVCLAALVSSGRADDLLPAAKPTYFAVERAPAAPPAVLPPELASPQDAPPVAAQPKPAPQHTMPLQPPLLPIMQTQPPPQPDMSQQPAPFTIDKSTPSASDEPHFFSGNVADSQDLSNLLPGNFKNTKYKWYGFVRLDGIFDFNPIKSTDDFVTSSIPIPQGRGQNVVLTPRYTRLGFDTSTPWDDMDWTIKTRIEVDFFNGNTSGVFGSFPLRLRFAWVDFGPFLIGQAASLFMDYDVFPNVLDYEGPPGMVLMRQPIFSVHCEFWDHFKVSVGVEQPYSDIQWFENGVWVVNPNSGIITTPGIGRNVQDMPDFTGNVRYTGDYGHFQVAGILRKLTFQPAVGAELNEVGYGVNLTGTWHPWAWLHHMPKDTECPEPWQRCRFLAQYAVGRGINRYIQDVNGFGLDATFDAAHGFRTIPSYGWFIAYEHWWAERWASNFTVAGGTWSQLTDTLPNSTYKDATYYSANLIWLPTDRMGVGIEYLYGSRENKDGGFGAAHRIQTGFQYKF